MINLVVLCFQYRVACVGAIKIVTVNYLNCFPQTKVGSLHSVLTCAYMYSTAHVISSWLTPEPVDIRNESPDNGVAAYRAAFARISLKHTSSPVLQKFCGCETHFV